MFDIKQIETEAQKELVEERSRAAKDKIKKHLKLISDAERVLANLKLEYQAILRDIGT
jgi:hypothetical protein